MKSGKHVPRLRILYGLPVLNLYTEATDGSYIETKESSLVWHHQDAESGFGSLQAKEMLDHLETVLANEPASLKMCSLSLKSNLSMIILQGVSKGVIAEKILASMKERGKQPDFELRIGDDRSDEGMFENIANVLPQRHHFLHARWDKKQAKANSIWMICLKLSALADATDPEPMTGLADDLFASVSSIDIGYEQRELK